VTEADQTQEPERTEKLSRNPKFIVGVIAVVLLVIFVAQNAQRVEVDFLFTTTDTPLVVALVIAGALGALIGWAVPRIRRHERG
jgi:uncharacterized integral membrane protein